MIIDLKGYGMGLENLISRFDEADVDFSEICRALRISFIEVFYSRQEVFENSHESIHHVIYENRECERGMRYCFCEKNNLGFSIRYFVYQIKGDIDWTEDEFKKVSLLEKLVFVHRDRLKIVRKAEELVTRDDFLDVYSLSYFTQKMKSYFEDKSITGFGACYFNIYNFSVVNQILSRKTADVVLKKYIASLKSIVGKGGFISRIYGDNFIMAFRKENIESVKSFFKGTEVYYDDSDYSKKILVVSHAGCYIIDELVSKPHEIIDRISWAYDETKKPENPSFIFYDEFSLHAVEKKELVELMFRDAIQNEEFSVYYQPKVNLKNYSLSGAEALCRWIKDGRLIPPNDFIPILEQSFMICELDFYMLDHVCRDICCWISQNKKVVRTSVNLSRKNLETDGLVEKIIEVVDCYGVPHSMIEIELTETTTDVSFTVLKRVVEELHEAGFATSIDDFGTGYSSVNLMRGLPWNVLKIDKSFLEETERSGTLEMNSTIQHIVSMAGDYGIECIAEGVETVEQVKLLKQNGCFYAQGYFFDRPLPKKDFETRLS